MYPTYICYKETHTHTHTYTHTTTFSAYQVKVWFQNEAWALVDEGVQLREGK